MRKMFIAFLILGSINTYADDLVYKYQDNNGNIVYTNVNPKKANVETIKFKAENLNTVSVDRKQHVSTVSSKSTKQTAELLRDGAKVSSDGLLPPDVGVLNIDSKKLDEALKVLTSK